MGVQLTDTLQSIISEAIGEKSGVRQLAVHPMQFVAAKQIIAAMRSAW